MPQRVYASEVNEYNPLDFSVDNVKPTPPKPTISHLANQPKIVKVSSPKKPNLPAQPVKDDFKKLPRKRVRETEN